MLCSRCGYGFSIQLGTGFFVRGDAMSGNGSRQNKDGNESMSWACMEFWGLILVLFLEFTNVKNSSSECFAAVERP